MKLHPSNKGGKQGQKQNFHRRRQPDRQIATDCPHSKSWRHERLFIVQKKKTGGRNDNSILWTAISIKRAELVENESEV
jgi:hypothetical protein